MRHPFERDYEIDINAIGTAFLLKKDNRKTFF